MSYNSNYTGLNLDTAINEVNYNWILLQVSGAVGSVTISCNSMTQTKTASSNKCMFRIPAFGAWLVSGTNTNQTAVSDTVNIRSVKMYSIDLSTLDSD